MIEWLKRDRLKIFWLAFHAIMGLLGVFFKVGVIVWFYLVLVSVITDLLRSANRSGVIHFFLLYTIGFEMLGRLSLLSPYLPYELGKYLTFGMLLIGIALQAHVKPNSMMGWVIVLFSIPSLMVIDQFNFKEDIVFNYLGLVNLGLAIVYFSGVRISIEELYRGFRLLLYPVVSVLAFVLVSSPDYTKVLFTLASNYETSGGFGPNQVSTILGLGCAIISVNYLLGNTLFVWKTVDIFLFFLFLFQALLTFSRGGVIGAGIVIVGIIILSLTNKHSSLRSVQVSFLNIVAICIVIFLVAWIANNITGDSLLNRYRGETQSTIIGKREKDLNSLTSFRWEALVMDIQIWKENPMLGVGPGGSSQARIKWGFDGLAAHTEASRLLSEHGMFGLLILILILIFTFKKIRDTKFFIAKIISLSLFIFALFSSVHSALRTMVTPLLFGLASADFFLRVPAKGKGVATSKTQIRQFTESSIES